MRRTVGFAVVGAWMFAAGCMGPEERPDEEPAPTSQSCPASIEEAWAAADPEVLATGAVIAHAASVRALSEMDPERVTADPDTAMATANEAAVAAWAALDPCTLVPTADGQALLTAAAASDGEPGFDPQSNYGTACRAACAGAGAAGCAAMALLCGSATVVTIGGFALPCTWAILAACTANAAGVVVCSEKYCPP